MFKELPFNEHLHINVCRTENDCHLRSVTTIPIAKSVKNRTQPNHIFAKEKRDVGVVSFALRFLSSFANISRRIFYRSAKKRMGQEKNHFCHLAKRRLRSFTHFSVELERAQVRTRRPRPKVEPSQNTTTILYYPGLNFRKARGSFFKVQGGLT